MKRTLITLLIALCFVSFALASTQATQVKQTTKATQTTQTTQAAKAQETKPAHKLYKGTIDTVTLADAAKGTKSEITVIGGKDQKQKMTFLVKSTTTIADADAKPLTLDKLQKGNKVRVRYTTTAENVHEAISITIVKPTP